MKVLPLMIALAFAMFQFVQTLNRVLAGQVNTPEGKPAVALSRATQDGAIELTLIVAGTAMPLPGALVMLQGPLSMGTEATSAAQATATTDKDGRATFRNLSPGQYLVRAQKDGYLGSGQSGIDLPASVLPPPVIIQPGQPPQKISLALTRGATISGTIADADGSPVASLRVSAGMLTYQNGRRTLLTRATAQTDDRGQYRLFWFGPGKYYIFGEFMPQRGLGAQPNVYAATFYPGTLDIAEATPVTITGSDDLAGIDFVLQRVKTCRVTGRVLNPPERSLPTGQTDNTISAFAYAPRDPNAPDVQTYTMIPNRMRLGTGEFDIVGIPPGSWNLFPVISLPPTAGASRTALPRYITGRAAIYITDKDIEGVTITLASTDVKGRVVMPPNSSALPAGFSIQNLRPSLQPREGIPDFLVAAASVGRTLGPNGEFEFPGIPLGMYSIVLPVPTPLYVADIRVGSRSIFNDGILIVGSRPLDPVQVILGTGSSNISGTVAGITPDTTVGQLTSTRIVLAPAQPRRHNPMLYRTSIISALTGSFYFGAVPPGDYKIFAFQGLSQGFEQDPAVLARYEDRGRAVTVTPGEDLNNEQVEWIRNAK